MSQPAKAQEPSMEEILASIRRIIADDDTAKPASPPAAAAPPQRPAALPPRNPIPPSPQAAALHPVDGHRLEVRMKDGKQITASRTGTKILRARAK